MKLEIIPYIGDRPIDVKPDLKTEIRSSPEYSRHIDLLVDRSRKITHINDKNDLHVTGQLGEIKAARSHIDNVRSVTLGPFLSLENGIRDAARLLDDPLSDEQQRLEDLVNSFGSAKQAERHQEALALEREKKEKVAARAKELAELEAQKQRLDIQRRNSVGLQEYGSFARDVKTLDEQIQDAKVALDFSEAAPVPALIYTEPLVRGGKFRLDISVKLVSARQLVELSGEDGWDLLDALVKCKIRALVATEYVKRKLEKGEDPVIPGCEVSIVKKFVKTASTPVKTK